MTDSTATAVIVHWGDVEPSLRVAAEVRPAFDDVLIIANDGARAPDVLPEGVVWLSSSNVGYAGACSLAVRLRPNRTSYAFLNNDLYIASRTCSALLAELTADVRLAVVGPRLLHADGRLQSGAGRWSPVLCAPLVRNDGMGVQRCGWVTGAAFFCSGRAVRELGFDHAYFLGQEDADFCDRAGAAGWKVALAADLTAVHDGRTTIAGPRWQYYSLRNWFWFVRRRRSKVRYALLVLWAALFLIPRGIAADLLRRRSLLHSRLAVHGLIDGMRPIPPAQRSWPDEPRPAKWMTW